MAITIRRLAAEEAATLAGFAETCFRESFGYLFPEEALENVCAKAFAAPLIATLIEQGAWIADSPSGWLGYVAMGLNPCPVHGLGEPHVELTRLYVSAPWHGQGVANELMKAFLDEARGRGFKAVWLEAFEGNPRALGFYARWGFRDLGGREQAREGVRLPHRILGTELA